MGTTMPVLCPIHPQPSPVGSDWSEEDWDGEIQKKKKEKQRKDKEMRQEQEEKKENFEFRLLPTRTHVCI